MLVATGVGQPRRPIPIACSGREPAARTPRPRSSRRTEMPRVLAPLRFACRVVVLATALAAPVHAQARFSGMVFADALAALHGSTVPADSSAFVFRRVQFTVDQDLDSVFAVRLQLEADGNELTSKGKVGVFVKQAWLRWA